MKIIITICTILFTLQPVFTQNPSIASLEGTWSSLGYNYVATVGDSKIQLYDICAIACSPNVTFSYEEFNGIFEVVHSQKDSFTIKEGVTEYDFIRIDTLPNICQQQKIKESNDPFYNFDVLWTTFNEQFAYFKERNIDWQSLRTKYRNKITAKTKPFELFLIMDDLLTELNDGHSVMFVPEKLERKHTKHLKKLRKIRIKELGYKPKPIHVDSTRYIIAKNYLKEVKTYMYGNINWGKINDSLGMIQINGMAQLANYNIPTDYDEDQAQSYYEQKEEASINYLQDEINGTRFIMDSILKDIENTKACIVDIRFNGGGFDAVGMEFLKSFAQKKGVAFTKKARMGSSYTKAREVEIVPINSAYKGKVYLLISKQSASAAETFSMGMKELCVNMEIIGSATEGVFSDRLEKVLPNGWSFGLSNEIYEDKDGNNFEGIGITPDHKIDYKEKSYWFYDQVKKAIENEGKDEAIEIVLDRIKE